MFPGLLHKLATNFNISHISNVITHNLQLFACHKTDKIVLPVSHTQHAKFEQHCPCYEYPENSVILDDIWNLSPLKEDADKSFPSKLQSCAVVDVQYSGYISNQCDIHPWLIFFQQIIFNHLQNSVEYFPSREWQTPGHFEQLQYMHTEPFYTAKSVDLWKTRILYITCVDSKLWHISYMHWNGKLGKN